MDTALDEDETELLVLIFPVLLQMLPHLHRFLDHVIQEGVRIRNWDFPEPEVENLSSFSIKTPGKLQIRQIPEEFFY